MTDSVENVKAAIVAAMVEHKDSHRSENADFYLSLLAKLESFQNQWPLKTIIKPLAKHQTQAVELPVITEQATPATASVGYDWFQALTGLKNPSSTISTVYYGDSDRFSEDAVVTTIVPDGKNPMYRVRDGEVGL